MSTPPALLSVRWPFNKYALPTPDFRRQPTKISLRQSTTKPALPEHNHPPPGFLKTGNSFLVAMNVASEFCLPEFDIGSRHGGTLAALMSMPEAPVNKYDRPILRKHEIRRSGQLSIMQSITQSLPMKKTSDQHFGARVLPANAGHHSRPDGRGNDVCHSRALFQLGSCPSNASFSAR